MLEPLAGPSDQLPLRPTQNPGPGRVDIDPDASAIGHAQHVLTDPPNAIPLGGPLLQPPLEKPFGILLVVNVGVGTDPAQDRAFSVEQRDGTDEMPSVFAIVTAESELRFKVVSRIQGPPSSVQR